MVALEEPNWSEKFELDMATGVIEKPKLVIATSAGFS